MAKNNLDFGIKCIKYMLLCITAMFVMTSALIISVGSTIYAIYYDVSYFLEAHYFSPAVFIIVIGVIMLFVSLFGCIGALKESTCLINLFAVILTVVLILEIAAAIAAYSLRAGMHELLDNNLRQSLPLYYKNPEVEVAYDFIQSRMNCCGVDYYTDWGLVDPPAGSPGISVNNMTVPESCCAESQYQNVDGLVLSECVKLYANGCLRSVTYLVYQSAGLLGTGAMTVAFIQIIGIVFAFTMAGAIRKAKSERDRRRWEIRERMINNQYTHLTQNNEKQAPIVYVPFYGQSKA